MSGCPGTIYLPAEYGVQGPQGPQATSDPGSPYCPILPFRVNEPSVGWLPFGPQLPEVAIGVQALPLGDDCSEYVLDFSLGMPRGAQGPQGQLDVVTLVCPVFTDDGAVDLTAVIPPGYGLLGPVSGAPALPVMRKIVPTDLPPAQREQPAGVLDGTNAVFTLTYAPIPELLQVYMNGILLNRMAIDYMLSGNTLTFVPGAIPGPNDVLFASYN
jgi:hypothetical protein